MSSRRCGAKLTEENENGTRFACVPDLGGPSCPISSAPQKKSKCQDKFSKHTNCARFTKDAHTHKSITGA